MRTSAGRLEKLTGKLLMWNAAELTRVSVKTHWKATKKTSAEDAAVRAGILPEASLELARKLPSRVSLKLPEHEQY